eukprot:TRINITY_DN14843_c0_g1_i1.p1 TRINITY_DN14843_c0_g1~~TRINITY_DN14843_c0_g1_i1.p1  ORF type:complete len:179 (-),score=17.75 TRINITY_DN14843_c0_g1_i1:35-526(-)
MATMNMIPIPEGASGESLTMANLFQMGKDYRAPFDTAVMMKNAQYWGERLRIPREKFLHDVQVQKDATTLLDLGMRYYTGISMHRQDSSMAMHFWQCLADERDDEGNAIIVPADIKIHALACLANAYSEKHDKSNSVDDLYKAGQYANQSVSLGTTLRPSQQY